MLNLGVCLGSWWTDGDDATVEATEIFRRLAFENIHAQCGGLRASLRAARHVPRTVAFTDNIPSLARRSHDGHPQPVA